MLLVQAAARRSCAAWFAMPSRSDVGSSSDSLLYDFDPHHPVVPKMIYDPDWDGLQIEGESNVPCDHGINLRKYVAFTGINTWRRFLGCENEVGPVCKIVDWVDVEWPDALKKCLVKLWKMYEMESIGRVADAFDAAKFFYKVSEEKKELEAENKNLQVVLNGTLSGAMVEGNAHKLLDIQKVEKQRDQLKEDKKKLEYYITDMLDAGDVNKDKLQRMKEILDE